MEITQAEKQVRIQIITHLFLSVFYTKSELGFSMEDYSISDISPEIINLVDKWELK